MTRATIRDMARRRLNEQTPDQWSDSVLDSFINLAYALVLKQVRKVDPEALLFWDHRDTEANVHWYEKPAGTRGPVEVGLKASSAVADWTPLTRKPYYIARDHTDIEEPVYCHRGTYIGIFPAPSVAVTDGIQFIHAPTDTLATDLDVPKVETTLHYAIALWATLLAKGESPEGDAKDAVELARILNDIPLDYGNPDQGQNVALSPDVGDARGRGGSIASSPGIDRR